MKKRYLILATGEIFEGEAFGADASAVGELVFTTGMDGYIETLTDPSYYGQIVMHTFPLIGNYGMISEDMESDSSVVRGYVVRDHCVSPSNFRSEGDIDAFLKAKGIPGICGVDTRRITRIIRDSGVMNACITDDPAAADMTAVKDYRITGAVAQVSIREKHVFPADGEMKHRVALLDFGEKYNIVRSLQARGCEVTVLPYNTGAEEVLALDPDGIMLTNGPGDPAENTGVIEELKKLLGKKPIFGICLGHQLLALAAGAKTEKLKYGHRGANQPVKRLSDGRVFITSQNHGYAVKSDTLDKSVALESFVNANDFTNEGIDYPAYRAFTVQFHPEACAGPKDTGFLFDRFVEELKS
ncbi:MAG: carbamoyl phosphate synthase small subunit [Clostridia bacterium]|nr:carbamoyl phosphate synthase small subunit [Clostridia bacterium]